MRQIEFEIELPNRDDPEDIERYKWEYQLKYKRGYRKRKKYVSFAFDAVEHERLKSRAKLEGKPLTRHILDGFYASEQKTEVKSRAYFGVVKELNKIGVNVNQIARAVNIDRSGYTEGVSVLGCLLKNLEDVKKGLLEVR